MCVKSRNPHSCEIIDKAVIEMDSVIAITVKKGPPKNRCLMRVSGWLNM